MPTEASKPLTEWRIRDEQFPTAYFTKYFINSFIDSGLARIRRLLSMTNIVGVAYTLYFAATSPSHSFRSERLKNSASGSQIIRVSNSNMSSFDNSEWELLIDMSASSRDAANGHAFGLTNTSDTDQVVSRWDPSDGKFELRFIGEAWGTHKGTTSYPADGTMYTIKITKNGNDYNLYVDDTLEINATDSQNTDLNKFFILSNENNTMYYDNISFRSGNPTGVFSDFDYNIYKQEAILELIDSSTVFELTIDDWDWFVDGIKVSDTQDYNYNIHCEQFNTGDWEAPVTTLSASQVEGTTITTLTFTCNDNNTGCTKTHYNINNEGWLNIANTGTADVNYDRTGANTILYFTEDDNDNNESQNSENFSTYGYLTLNFYKDTFDTSLDEVYLEFDGNAYDSDTNTYITLNLEGITSGEKNILIQKTGYQEKNFYLNLNQYSAETYDIGFILSTRATNIEFKVYTKTGATKPNTKFFAYDNNYLIDVQTTDSTGTMSMYLNNTKTDYNFISTDLNFSTTTWTLKKPKDALTLDAITGDWSYSITGNAYASQTHIAGDTTKILLQNTVTPYYIKIQDVNKAYYLASFGLKSITSEKNKTLNSYLYPVGSADLVLIKLLDFSTNQPISDFKELTLSIYTDTNGLIDIGSYINDSTGTYNIYMNSNSQYQLIIEEQTFILNPTLTIYYLYLTSPSGLNSTNDVNSFTTPYVDLNSPIIMSQVREYFFGCSAEEENCYPSIIFSLIFLVVLAIGFSIYLTVGSLEQSILILVLLGMFTFAGFIPLWLFAISAVITVLWAVFS